MTVETTTADRLQRIGDAFVNAVADRDFDGLRAAMTDDVRFRLLVPKGPQAHEGAADTVARFVGWYADVDEVVLEDASVTTVAERLVVAYRLRLRDAGGWRLIEQHVVADVAPDGRLNAIDLLCTGFHPEAEPTEQKEEEP